MIRQDSGQKPKRSITRLLRIIFVPIYSEVALFLISLLFILLLISDRELQSLLGQIFLFFSTELSGTSSPAIIYLIPYMLLLFIGILLSIFHVASSRKKSEFEKKIMMGCMGLINGITGIYAGIHLLKISSGLLLIFPILNVIYGFVNFTQLWMSENIEDRNATHKEIRVGLFFICLLFLLFRLIFYLEWSITLSICTIYAINFNKWFQRTKAGTAN
jgi:hypothetical protein